MDTTHPANPPLSADLDLDRFRLRNFLAGLGADEVESREQPIDLADVAAVLEGNPKAVRFQSVGPERAGAGRQCRVAAARASPAPSAWRRSALAAEIQRRLAASRRDRRGVARRGAGAADGADRRRRDLTALPVHLQHGLDGAPYISAAIDFALDPPHRLDQCGHAPADAARPRARPASTWSRRATCARIYPRRRRRAASRCR